MNCPSGLRRTCQGFERRVLQLSAILLGGRDRLIVLDVLCKARQPLTRCSQLVYGHVGPLALLVITPPPFAPSHPSPSRRSPAYVPSPPHINPLTCHASATLSSAAPARSTSAVSSALGLTGMGTSGTGNSEQFFLCCFQSIFWHKVDCGSRECGCMRGLEDCMRG